MAYRDERHASVKSLLLMLISLASHLSQLILGCATLGKVTKGNNPWREANIIDMLCCHFF